ncbi:MAG: cellulase family glycosylhydrolase [Rhizobiaceae bacterium]
MRLFKTLIILLLAATPVCAATFEGRSGISLDIWTTWPQESKWADESVLFPFPEWRRTLTDADLKDLADSGYDFVRIPIDPAPFLSDQSAPFRDRLYEETGAAIDMALGAGLSVIVDMHPIPAGERSIGTTEILESSDQYAAYLDMLRRMALLIKDRDPKRVALELFNEPTNDCKEDNTNTWPGMMRQAFAAARASATKLTLVLSGSCWGGAEGLAKLDAKDFPDDNLIWSFHSYDPFILTHQGATWTGDFMPHVYGLPYPLHEASKDDLDAALDAIRVRIKRDAPATRVAGHLAYLDEEIAKISTKEGLDGEMDKPFSIVADWAKSNGVDPADILLGEFGMIRQEYGNDHEVPANTRSAFYQAQIERAEKYGFRWAAFSYGGAFALARDWDGKAVERVITP